MRTSSPIDPSVSIGRTEMIDLADIGIEATSTVA